MRKRRGQNQGSVYQLRSDGRWVAQVTIQKKHSVKYFYSQPEPGHPSNHQGVPITGPRITLAAYFSFWLEIMPLSLRPKTRVHYQQVIKKHILPGLGGLITKELQPDQIQALYKLKQREGASDRTLSLINCVLHNALEHGVKTKILLHNPVREVIKPRVHYHEQKVLNIDQVKVFLQACRDTRWEALFCLAVTTGLREGELLGLK